MTTATSGYLHAAHRGSARRWTPAERNFWKAAAGVAGIVLVFWCGYLVERELLHRTHDARFVREASEAAMRYITIPHILIGFFFMLSSPRNRTFGRRMTVVLLMLAGAALCGLYGYGGGKANALLYLGVYLYFIVHELRDEAMFYSLLGEPPPIADPAAFRSMIRSMIALILFSVVAVLWAPAPFGTFARKLAAADAAWGGTSLADHPLFSGAWPLAARIAVAAGPALVVAAAYVLVLRLHARRLGYAGPAELLSAHAPLFRVMFGVVGVLGLSLLITQRAYSLILFHVVAWYVFAVTQFNRHPPKAPPAGWWMWMRTTATGFRVLHIGLAAGLMLVGLVWTYALGRPAWLDWLLLPESFLYWTIMHVTVSFVPR